MKKQITFIMTNALLVCAGATFASNAQLSNQSIATAQEIHAQQQQLSTLNRTVNHNFNATTLAIKNVYNGVKKNKKAISKLNYTINLMQLQTPTYIQLVAIYGTVKDLTAELRVNGSLQEYKTDSKIAPEIKLCNLDKSTATFQIKNRKITLHVGNNLKAYPTPH